LPDAGTRGTAAAVRPFRAPSHCLNPPRGLDSVVSLQHLDEPLERKMTEIEHAQSWSPRVVSKF
jgi:hypothetical protein